MESWYVLHHGRDARSHSLGVREVFKLANIIQHDRVQDPRDAEGRPGSFLACHSEKQVLAYLIFHHTSAYLVNNDDDEETLDSLQKSKSRGGRKVIVNCEPPTLKELKANVFVCQPGRDRSRICGDCIEFCRRVTIKFGLRLDLHTVTNEDGGAWEQVGRIVGVRVPDARGQSRTKPTFTFPPAEEAALA